MNRKRLQLWMILRGTMYLLSLNIAVFVRRQFGERVAGDLCVACGFSWFCFWSYAVARARMLPHLPESHLSQFFLYALCGMTAYHIGSMWLRGNRAGEVHSYSTGRPFRVWRYLGFTDMTLQRYIQPAACSLLARGISSEDRVLAHWICMASIAVFVEEQVSRARIRTRVLDVIDSRIESKTLFARVQEKLLSATGRETQSPVAEIAEMIPTKTENIEGIIGRLDPELRKMLEPPGESNGGRPQ